MRISGLSEADYGWNQPQDAFKVEHSFPLSRSIAAYDRPFDIIIAGDSFSFRSNTSWINTLVEATGMSVLALQVNGASVSKIIHHPQFQQSPPRYFIFESVERRLYDRLEQLDIPETPLIARSQAPRQWQPKVLERQALSRVSAFASVEQRFAHAVHVIRVKLGCLLDTADCKVVTQPLKAAGEGLFSSKASNRIAVLKKAYASRRKWAERRPEALKRLKTLNDYFSAAPDTQFVLMVYPDKLSVYSEFIDADNHPVDKLIPEVAEIMDIPRLDIAFRKAIAERQVDLYLPNDSHSGGAANALAAQVVIEKLIRQ